MSPLRRRAPPPHRWGASPLLRGLRTDAAAPLLVPCARPGMPGCGDRNELNVAMRDPRTATQCRGRQPGAGLQRHLRRRRCPDHAPRRRARYGGPARPGPVGMPDAGSLHLGADRAVAAARRWPPRPWRRAWASFVLWAMTPTRWNTCWPSSGRADVLAELHLRVEGDEGYSCAQARDQDDLWSRVNDLRAAGPCDCGRDERVRRRLEMMAEPH